MNLNHVSIVLVEPQGALNIGSVCRAMMNFGFCDLRLVAPQRIISPMRRGGWRSRPVACSRPQQFSGTFPQPSPTVSWLSEPPDVSALHHQP
jgi:hypothetical protein